MRSARPLWLYGAAYCSLYQRIDTEKVQCLNESIDGSGVTVFKPWEDRLDVSKVKNYSFFLTSIERKRKKNPIV